MKKMLFVAFFIALGFGLVACEPEQAKREAITITFTTNSHNSLHPLTYIKGQNVELPHLADTKESRFAGWFYDAALTQEATDLSSKNQDFTLFGKWEDNLFDMIVDVYNEVHIKALFMNDTTRFILDESGDLYIQYKKGNPLYNESSKGESVLYQGAFGSSPNNDITVSLTADNAYVVTSSNRVFSYGDNTYGQLGTGDTVNAVQFMDITAHFDLSENEVITKVVGNATTTFALTSRGEIYAWGDNVSGLIGDPTVQRTLTPSKITDYVCGQTDHFLVDIGVTDNNAMALTSNHELLIWGADPTFWLGESMIHTLYHPQNITDAIRPFTRGAITRIEASSDTFVLISSSDEILLIGDSLLATDASGADGKPVSWIPDFTRDEGQSIKEVHISGETLFVTQTSGQLWAMGDNSAQRITGKKGYDYYQSLSEVRLPIHVDALAISAQEACAVSDKELWCWGSSSTKNLRDDHTMVLLTEYRHVAFEGDRTLFSGEEEDQSQLVSALGPIRWMAPEALIAPEFSTPYRLYVVTRAYVSGIPYKNDNPETLASIINNLCKAHANDCDDHGVTVHPDAYMNHQLTNGIVHWTLEVRVDRVELA